MNSQTNRRLRIAVVAIGILVAGPAMATASNWDGQTIGVEYLYPELGFPIANYGGLLVGPGVEGVWASPQDPVFNFDISANQIVMDFAYGFEGSWDSTSFNGPHFWDYLGSAPDLTGVTINGATTMAGLDIGDLTWNADNVFVNWQGLGIFPGMQVVLDLQFNGEPSVPEASTWAAGGVLAAAVGGLWLRRRRA